MAIQKGTKLYAIDQTIKRQNARLNTWMKHADFESNLTGGTSEISEFQTLQNNLILLTNRHPELKQFAQRDKYGRITGFSRSQRALEAFNNIPVQDLKVIERQPTYGDVYERQKKSLQKDLKRSGMTLTSKKGMSIRKQVEKYIKESSEIQFALNAMGTLYALSAENSTPANEILEILRGTDKGGKRGLREDGKYQEITPEQWDIVRANLGIVSRDPRFKPELAKRQRRNRK